MIFIEATEIILWVNILKGFTIEQRWQIIFAKKPKGHLGNIIGFHSELNFLSLVYLSA